MTSTEGDDGPFEPEAVSDVADSHDVGRDAVEEALARHQSSVERLPGVENLAYEWRRQYQSPLVERTPSTYYLVVPARIWDEFADALDVDERVRDAMIAVHRRTTVTDTDAPSDPPADQAYVVLDRTVKPDD